jgi:cytidylate kinase
MAINIAIDGPAGAGKSTIAKRLAKELGYIYVDTGAMYRAMAYFLIKSDIPADDEGKVAAAAEKADISIEYRDGEQCVLLNGENVNPFLRQEEVGRMASLTSKYPFVREKLVALQQELAKKSNVIMDGRDIGTVVLPNADVKIYDELTAKGETCDIDVIEQDIIDRDYQDMHRETSPLKQASDAVLLDSSSLDIDGVVAKMKDIIQKAGVPT